MWPFLLTSSISFLFSVYFVLLSGDFNLEDATKTEFKFGHLKIHYEELRAMGSDVCTWK